MSGRPQQPAPRVRQQLPRFVLVGCGAAAVHFGVVVALVEGGTAWPPLAANVVAWTVAFGVSYAGHRWLSFAGQGAGLRRSFLRFLAVSFAGFVVNEAAYALLLGVAGWRYDLALAGVLVAVAALTFVASRHWAFAPSPAGTDPPA